MQVEIARVGASVQETQEKRDEASSEMHAISQRLQTLDQTSKRREQLMKTPERLRSPEEVKEFSALDPDLIRAESLAAAEEMDAARCCQSCWALRLTRRCAGRSTRRVHHELSSLKTDCTGFLNNSHAPCTAENWRANWMNYGQLFCESPWVLGWVMSIVVGIPERR